jgi:flagellar hook-associated protein 1
LNNLFTGQTAMDMAVHSSVKADPMLLAAAKNGSPADNQIARAIASLETQPLTGLNGQSLKDAYQSMVNGIAVASSDAKTNAEATGVVKETLLSQREALSGVSLDEEAINLMRQQRAFQAASRLIAVVDEMMQVVLGLV